MIKVILMSFAFMIIGMAMEYSGAIQEPAYWALYGAMFAYATVIAG